MSSNYHHGFIYLLNTSTTNLIFGQGHTLLLVGSGVTVEQLKKYVENQKQPKMETKHALVYFLAKIHEGLCAELFPHFKSPVSR